jgi:hypothetical protein
MLYFVSGLSTTFTLFHLDLFCVMYMHRCGVFQNYIPQCVEVYSL